MAKVERFQNLTIVQPRRKIKMPDESTSTRIAKELREEAESLVVTAYQLFALANELQGITTENK